MNITIKTLTVSVDDKTVPLTKAMVNQFEYLEGKFANNECYLPGGNCEVLGEVSTTDGLFVLVATPHGVQKANIGRIVINEILQSQGKRLERIILTK